MTRKTMTIQVDPEEYRRFKAQVMLEGTTVREVITELMRQWTEEKERER